MSKRKPKLSVLIPTYNREKYVGVAIESVLNQKYSDLEIICSDNASTDKTFQILQKYQNKDERIKVFQNEINLGPVWNWKRCLENASGKFIHWLWSDDWIEKNFYIDAFQMMESDGTSVLSTWNYRSDNQSDTQDKYLSWQFSFARVPGPVAARKILTLSSELPVSPAAYILPKKLVEKHFYTSIPKFSDKIDPVSNGVGVDSLMVVGCCLAVEKVSVLQKPSVVFRKHENLSVQLSREGTLTKMYLISHLWFMSKMPVFFGPTKLIRFALRSFKYLRNDVSYFRFATLLLKISLNIVFKAKRMAPDSQFVSAKAYMK